MLLQRVPQYRFRMHSVETTGLALHWDNPSPSLCYILCKNCHTTPAFCPKIITQGVWIGSCRASCTVLSFVAQLISSTDPLLTNRQVRNIWRNVLCSCHLASWCLLSCHLQGGQGSQTALCCPWNLDTMLLLSFHLVQHPQAPSRQSCKSLHWQSMPKEKWQREWWEMRRKKHMWKEDNSNLAWAYIQKCQTYTLSLAVKELPCFINRLKTFHHGIVLIV